MTEREIKRLEKKVYKCEIELNGALSQLATAVSSVLGYDVVAELCGGSEIEFRIMRSDGIAVDSSCIRMEDVLKKLK